MNERAALARRRWRRWLQPLQATPLHPQWLAVSLAVRRRQWLETRAAGRVLDVGCADGTVRHQLPGITSYVGVDYPTTASQLYGTRPQVFADAAALPFADGSFDTVMLLDVLEHVAEPEAALREACRVLVKRGRLLVTIPFAYPLHDLPHDYQRFTAPGLARRLGQANLTPLLIEEVGGGARAAALGLSLSIAQGALDALAARSWRIVFIPPALLLVPVVNLCGWLLSRLLPTHGLLPGAYFVHAERQ